MGSIDSLTKKYTSEQQIEPYLLNCHQLKKEMRKVKKENTKLKRKINDLKYKMFPYCYWTTHKHSSCDLEHPDNLLIRNLDEKTALGDILKYLWAKNKKEIFVVTVALVCLTALPIIMFIMGIQFVRDCPKEPRIPIYMIVGGSFGTIKMFWMIWRQVRSRRFERRQQRGVAPALSAPSRVADFLLTAFLLVWFICGNIWILSIYWPQFEPKLFDPNNWCHKSLYIFALVHLGVLYSILGIIVLMSLLFLACQLSSSLFVSLSSLIKGYHNFEGYYLSTK